MQEVDALIAAARNIKHQRALSVAYGAGMCASEDCRLDELRNFERTQLKYDFAAVQTLQAVLSHRYC